MKPRQGLAKTLDGDNWDAPLHPQSLYEAQKDGLLIVWGRKDKLLFSGAFEAEVDIPPAREEGATVYFDPGGILPSWTEIWPFVKHDENRAKRFLERKRHSLVAWGMLHKFDEHAIWEFRVDAPCSRFSLVTTNDVPRANCVVVDIEEALRFWRDRGGRDDS